MGRLYNALPENTNLTIALFSAGGLLVSLALDWGLGAATNHMYGPKAAESYLEQSGYSNPELTGIDEVLVGLRGCDQADTVGYHFNAEASNGKKASVIVCKGILKHATIREG